MLLITRLISDEVLSFVLCLSFVLSLICLLCLSFVFWHYKIPVIRPIYPSNRPINWRIRCKEQPLLDTAIPVSRWRNIATRKSKNIFIYNQIDSEIYPVHPNNSVLSVQDCMWDLATSTLLRKTEAWGTERARPLTYIFLWRPLSVRRFSIWSTNHNSSSAVLCRTQEEYGTIVQAFEQESSKKRILPSTIEESWLLR